MLPSRWAGREIEKIIAIKNKKPETIKFRVFLAINQLQLTLM